MTFTTPLALLLFALIPVFAYVGWPRLPYRRRRDALSLALRLLIVTLLVLGLAGAQIVRAAEKLAVVFLVDVSDSMDSAAQAAALDYVRDAMALSGPDDQSAVILFGANALVERPMLPGTELGPIGSTPVTLNTDLAEAIRLGLALFPADAARRMVILSDGIATVGDTLEAGRLAAASGVQIDFVAFRRRPAPEVMVTAVNVPTRLNVDEPFEVSYTITSEADTQAVVSILAGGATIARGTVSLREGENNFVQTFSGFPTTAFVDLRVQVEPLEAAADGFYQNNQLSTFTEVTGPPRILLVRQNGPDGEAAVRHLTPALEEVGLAIDIVAPDDLPIGLAPLSAYASVILVDVPAADLSPQRMETLHTYVRDLGGGLVVIGGPHSYGVGGYFHTPLEEALPVEMQIRDQERLPALTLIFVIDTSGSMGAVGPSGYTNLDLAKEAIIRSIDLLNPVDRLGVVSFETAAAWIIDVTTVDNPSVLQETVATLRPGGGTDILAGLNAAAAAIESDPTAINHIILLTDGGASPEGIVPLVERLRIESGTTTSVVAIGEGYAPFLQDVANAGQGNFHFARDVSTIPSIFTAETILATRSYIVEGEFFPVQVGDSPILTGIRRAPSLLGYVATTAKDAAQVLLRSPEPNADPILAAWQYGLGRAVAWTSDATGRWAVNWIDWENYPRFFSQAVRWTITEGINSSLETRVEQRGEQAVLVVDARDRQGNFLNGLLLQAAIVNPDLQAENIPLYQVAPGRYEAIFQPGDEGAYFLRVAGQPLPGADVPENVVVAQTSGWVLTYSPEYRLPETGVNLELLNDLANLTGGGSLFQRPEEVFVHNLAAQSAATPLWPWMLLAAALLLPFDIGVRRLIVTTADLRRLSAWLSDKLGFSIKTPAEITSERLGRLMSAKQRAIGDLPRGVGPPPDVTPDATIRAVLGQDERKAPTPAAPPGERPPAPAAGATTAASLLERKRAAREEPPARERDRGERPAVSAPGAPETRPAPPPGPESKPRVLSRPEDEPSTASRLLEKKRRGQR